MNPLLRTVAALLAAAILSAHGQHPIARSD